MLTIPTREVSLEQAQIEKMHHVCRKVRLKPGMQVVEAGCGWGSLAMHMAEHYGVQVKAFNITHQQVAYARERAKAKGLSDRVEFIEEDYRNVSGEYDAFVSVGMLEHVGKDNYKTFGDVIYRTLKRGGLGIVHSVGRSITAPPNAWLEQRIFPGSYPPSLRDMLNIFESHEFSILDVENLRLHYAETLKEWLRRFDDQVDEITRMYDESFVRAWRTLSRWMCRCVSRQHHSTFPGRVHSSGQQPYSHDERARVRHGRSRLESVARDQCRITMPLSSAADRRDPPVRTSSYRPGSG